MKILFHTFILITLTLKFFLISTYADEFGEGDLKFHISFVPIASNAPSDNFFGHSLPYTSYNYRIGKTEISIAQFLQARAADSRISRTQIDFWNSGKSNLHTDPEGKNPKLGVHAPVSYINIIECFKFCNWLTSGDPYQGAYKIIASENPENDTINPEDYINRDSAIDQYQTIYVIPTFNEWNKAAFMKPDGSGFSFYSNGAGSGNIYTYNKLQFENIYNEPPKDIMFTNYNDSEDSYRYVDTEEVEHNITPPKGWYRGWNSNFYEYPWSVGSSAREQNGTYDMFGNVGEYFEDLEPFLTNDYKTMASTYNYLSHFSFPNLNTPLGGDGTNSSHMIEAFFPLEIHPGLRLSKAEGGNFGRAGLGLRIVSIGIIPPESPMPEVRSTITDGAAHLNWDSTVGRIYQLQYTHSLENPNWVDIGQKINGSGGTEFFVVPVDTIEEKNRFYRVIDAD